MRLEQEIRTGNSAGYQYSDNSLEYELNSLKRIYQILMDIGGSNKNEAMKYIKEYNELISGDDFNRKIFDRVEYHIECFELMSEMTEAIRKIRQLDVPAEGGVSLLYYDLEKINTVLSNPETTASQAEELLKEYHNLISNKENTKLINDVGGEAAKKVMRINDDIQEYLIKRDMVTFGYFTKKMEGISKYAYNISVNYQRKSMDNYINFYKDVTKKLNTFGDYIKGSVDDGKKNIVLKNKFYTDIYRTLEPYFYYGDGKGHVLYENSIKLIKSGHDKFDVIIGGELIEKNISYEDAYKKMEYFFSCHEPVIKGTRLCKLIKLTKDENGNIFGVEGKVEQFLFPTELYYFMELSYHEDELNKINDKFNENISKLSKWNCVNEESIAATSNIEYTKMILNKNYDAGYVTYYDDEADRNTESHFYQHNINTMNQKIDGAKKGLQLILDEYTQRYNTVNSNYDHMLRTITTMISELSHELKGFLRF